MTEGISNAVPFPQESELCSDLDLVSLSTGGTSSASKIAHMDRETTGLPGEPWLDLHSSELRTFLYDELLTPGLDKLSPYLWLVATQRSDHISPLHQQIVKGRQIMVAENPELHCTWMYNHVYLKPIPPYLLSWAFWQYYFNTSSILSQHERDRAKAAALGFLRTYSFLILHASDFRIAADLHLIPANISYTKLRFFLTFFRKVSDSKVSKRYQFGELRLRRVNFWARIFLRRFFFQKVQVHYTCNAYFGRFYGPVLFIFAFFSTTLSAMQVGLASESIDKSFSSSLKFFAVICWWYSITTILAATLLLTSLILLLVYRVLREFSFALNMLIRKKGQSKRSKRKNEEE